jgi:hypothetical protein
MDSSVPSALQTHSPAPKKEVHLQPSRHLGKDRQNKGSPRWGVNIIATGNQLGFQQFLQSWEDTYMQNFYETIQQAINTTLPANQQITDITKYIPTAWSPQSRDHRASDHHSMQDLQLLGCPSPKA